MKRNFTIHDLRRAGDAPDAAGDQPCGLAPGKRHGRAAVRPVAQALAAHRGGAVPVHRCLVRAGRAGAHRRSLAQHRAVRWPWLAYRVVAGVGAELCARGRQALPGRTRQAAVLGRRGIVGAGNQRGGDHAGRLRPGCRWARQPAAELHAFPAYRCHGDCAPGSSAGQASRGGRGGYRAGHLRQAAVARLRGGAGRHRRHYAAGFRHAGAHDPGAGHRAGDEGDQSGQRAVGLRYHAGLPRSGGAAAGVAAVV
ncbi:hypothetical protein G6F59_014835 [Rhizopus arrhizus]|nr:hypothetical protein G6F59_014835 [Rhizopus arrhizus]